MARVISVYNKKGGVGKTTVGVNLAATIATTKNKDGSLKYRVLLIDMDTQENASDALHVGSAHRVAREGEKAEKLDLGRILTDSNATFELVSRPYSLTTWLPSNADGDDVMETEIIDDIDKDGNPIMKVRRFRETVFNNFMIVPAYANMGQESLDDDEDAFRSRLDPRLMSNKLKEIDGQYDYIILDCPPSWDRMTKMALLASQMVLVPTKPGFYEQSGMIRVKRQIETLKAGYGTKPKHFFVSMNMVKENIKGHMKYLRRTAAFIDPERKGGIISETSIPYAEKVMDSASDAIPFAFGGARYSDMASVFMDFFLEIDSLFNQGEKENG